MKQLNAVLVGVFALAGQALAAEPLPDLQADTTKISVSGLSSGAAMTTQLSVAYSDRVQGVGMMAGPPYLCAQGSSTKALASCLTMKADLWGIPVLNINLAKRDDVDVDNLVASARKFAAVDGSIPPLDNLKQQRVWVSRGSKDAIVGPNATQAVREFYTRLEATLAPAETPNVPHTLPTDKPGLGACDGRKPDPNYVSSCGVDDVGKMFGYLFNWQPAERGEPKAENLKPFDQTPYLYSSSGRKRSAKELSMATEGRVYIPADCRGGGCTVHVAIHGCQQGKEKAYDLFTRLGGYNDWAEKHRMIVLYPRVVANEKYTRPINPRGCWDWWGYTPDDRADWRGYAKREAPQMRSIMNMVDALAGKAPR